MIDTIVRELCARSAPYAEALAATLGRRVEIRSDISVGHAVNSEISAVSVGTLQLGLESPRSMFSRCVQAPLESIENPPRVVLIVDAVDETNSPGLDNELVLLLTAALRGLANSPLDFRLVLTCRTVEQDNFRHLAAEVVDLDRDEPRAGDDMLLFCRSRFATAGGSQPDDRAELVAAKAQGNYLYAKYAIGLLSEPGAALDAAELPAGLGDIYREYLTRRVANDLGGRDWRARYRPVLGLLAVAREPGLTVGDLVAVLRLPESAVEDTVDDVSEFLRADPRTSRWGIFHDSFRTFLLADDALRIRSEEAHQVLGEAFLASGPLSAPDYLLQNFAYHLHGAGMHRELCEYATSADRWQEHEQRTGVLLSVRFTTLLTACDSAIALDSPEFVVRLMVRDLELRSQLYADPDLAAQDVDRLAADALVQLGDYDFSVIWQLVRACQEVEDGQCAAAVARLRDLAGWATRSLGGDWQYQICGLLAHLRAADPDGPVRGLCHALFDDVGVSFLKRYLFERGATTAALEEPEISDSHRYRYGVLRYAIDLAEKRCDPAGALEVARHVRRSARPTVFEDLAFCAAASWNAVDGVAEALARLSDYRVLHADALAARGRPEAAEDQEIRTRARAEIAGLLRDSSYPNDQWIAYHSAVAARRDGDPVEARRILRSLRERMPRLDSAPDGAFVAGNHLDVEHGPCLQGLVLLMGMEAATVRDFALTKGFSATLSSAAAHRLAADPAVSYVNKIA